MALGETDYVGTVDRPELYPPGVNTPDKKKRWDWAHELSAAYFGTSRFDPTVRFYALMLYSEDILPGPGTAA